MFRRLFESSRRGAEPPPAIDPAVILRNARRLRFRVDPEAVAELAGAYHAARPGAGLTFTELKPYEPGDDVRHIDWNVTARQDRPYIRRYVEERSLLLRLVVDVSASMRFGPRGATKADRATQAAALLASTAIQNGDQAGLCLVGSGVAAEVEPATGVAHLSRLLRLLVAPVPLSDPKRTNLASAIAGPSRRLRRGLIIILSDFVEAGPAGPWRRASRANQILALRLVDPREDDLPDAGLLALADAETGQELLVDSSSRRVRAAYAHAARLRRSAFQGWCAEARATGYDLSTTDDPVRPLLRIFRERATRRARRG